MSSGVLPSPLYSQLPPTAIGSTLILTIFLPFVPVFCQTFCLLIQGQNGVLPSTSCLGNSYKHYIQTNINVALKVPTVVVSPSLHPFSFCP
ncbi:hypothetical protein V8C37DRAFT_366541 [Trichoderma ceciliae]